MDGMVEKIISIQDKVTQKAASQEKWKNQAIEIGIKSINGATHRDKDHYLKELLMHLIGMPAIQEADLGIENDDLPF